jgi:hypothetical protein
MEPHWKKCYAQRIGVLMHIRADNEMLFPAFKRWSRSRARILCPRRHLRVLPTRTRPNLFGDD